MTIDEMRRALGEHIGIDKKDWSQIWSFDANVSMAWFHVELERRLHEKGFLVFLDWAVEDVRKKNGYRPSVTLEWRDTAPPDGVPMIVSDPMEDGDRLAALVRCAYKALGIAESEGGS